ncbi:MAG: formylmethanofuran dehydrogenase subunit B [Pirellulaceae bacterium]
MCDDLRLRVADNGIVDFAPPCPLADRWFARFRSPVPSTCQVYGRPATFDEAIQQAAALLRQSAAPLVYGLSGSSTHGQRAAIELAEQLGANIDTSASTCHGPSILALQQVGESTCTLGEIKNRADLIVYWGSDPVVSHPRHLERYSADARGENLPRGRADRWLAVVDIQDTATSERADLTLLVEPGGDFDVIWALRCLLRREDALPAHVGGIGADSLRAFAARLKSCRCGVFFFGRGLTQGPLGHAAVESLLLLTRDLNAWTRFHARRMRVYGDVAGADTVLCWQTGFPFSVNLARGYPRYGPGEYSANELLERREVDCCLALGIEGIQSLSPAARETLNRIPTIVVNHDPEPTLAATVFIPTAVYGVHLAGTAYRMDEVPIRLRPVLHSPLPSDADVLRRLARAIRP